MTLAEMIRKRRVGHRANANPANLANEGIPATESLATLAALAVANPPEPKTPNPTGELAAEEKVAVSRWWRIHYADRPPVEVVYAPGGSHDEILKWNPEAIKVEPFEPIRRKPTEPLSASQAAKIRAWLRHICETEEGISEVIDQCNTNADARAGFLRSARMAITQGY